MKLFKMFGGERNDDIEQEPAIKRSGVLIVDDSRFSRNVLRDILLEEDFEVVGEASDGLEAIQKAKELRPEFIFLDVEMPKLDGLGALPQLLEDDPGVNVIMCTALGQKKIIIEATKAGAKDYVIKPYKKEHITDLLEALKPEEAEEEADNNVIPFDSESKAAKTAYDSQKSKSSKREKYKPVQEYNKVEDDKEEPNLKQYTGEKLGSASFDEEERLPISGSLRKPRIEEEEIEATPEAVIEETVVEEEPVAEVAEVTEEIVVETEQEVEEQVEEPVAEVTDTTPVEEEHIDEAILELIEADEDEMYEGLVIEDEAQDIEEFLEEVTTKMQEEVTEIEEEAKVAETTPEEEIVAEEVVVEEELVAEEELVVEEEAVAEETIAEEETVIEEELVVAEEAEEIIVEETVAEVADATPEEVIEEELVVEEVVEASPVVEEAVEEIAATVEEAEEVAASEENAFVYLWTDRFEYEETSKPTRSKRLPNRVSFKNESFINASQGSANPELAMLGHSNGERLARLGMMNAYMEKGYQRVKSNRLAPRITRTLNTKVERSFVEDILQDRQSNTDFSIADIVSNIDVNSIMHKEEEKKTGIYSAIADMVTSKGQRKLYMEN